MSDVPAMDIFAFVFDSGSLNNSVSNQLINFLVSELPAIP